MTNKKIPQRMCIVCKQMFDKKDLIRIVKNDDGFALDITGKLPGRGSYICKNGCIDKCAQTHALEKAYKIPVDAQTYKKIIEEFSSIVNG